MCKVYLWYSLKKVYLWFYVVNEKLSEVGQEAWTTQLIYSLLILQVILQLTASILSLNLRSTHVFHIFFREKHCLPNGNACINNSPELHVHSYQVITTSQYIFHPPSIVTQFVSSTLFVLTENKFTRSSCSSSSETSL